MRAGTDLTVTNWRLRRRDAGAAASTAPPRSTTRLGIECRPHRNSCRPARRRPRLTRGIAAPKGTPEPVIKRLQEVFKKAMEDPEHVKKMEEAGLALKIMVGEEYATYYRELHAKATKYTEWARNRPHK